MADVRIQDLLSTTTVADNDLFVVEDNADTKKITKSNLVSTLGINDKAPTVHTHPMSQITDYEEGTWTPVVSGSTVAGVGNYSVQLGRFTKIGRMVYFSLELSWSSHTGTGALDVTLPFTNGDIWSPCSIISSNLTYPQQLGAMVLPNFNRLRLHTFGSNLPLDWGYMDAGAHLFISGFYML